MKDLERDLIEKNLGSILDTCLGGPGGDPDRCHMKAASTAYATLVFLGFKEDVKEDERRRFLAGKNIHKTDFLEEWGL